MQLYTHASLMFNNKCLGDLGYESVTSAIVMAGLFLSFIVEYIGHRVVLAKEKAMAARPMDEKTQTIFSAEVVTILVLEAGILFHSLRKTPPPAGVLGILSLTHHSHWAYPCRCGGPVLYHALRRHSVSSNL